MADEGATPNEPLRGPDGWENWRAQMEGKPYAEQTVEMTCYSDSHLVGEIREGPFQLLNTVPGGV